MKFVDRAHRSSPTSRQPQLGNRPVHLGPPAGFHLTRLSGARLVLLGLAISILTSLVVFASNGASAVGGRTSHSPAVAAIGQTIVLLAIIGDLAFMALVAYAVWSGRRRGKGSKENERGPYQPPVHWIWKVVAAALPLLFLLGLVLALHATSAQGVHPSPSLGIPTGKLPPGARPAVGRTRTPGFTTPALVAAGAITLVAIVIGFLLTRVPPNRGSKPLLARDLSESIDDSLDDIRREGNPRRAVIAAYARMERVLRLYGLPRRDYEAPREYLVRILGGLHVREEAIGSLTDLFELARFSQHDIGPWMKEEAISSLIAVLDDLEAAA